MRNIITRIDVWPPAMEKDHPITNFVMSVAATDNIKNDIIDLKERGELLEMNLLEDLQRRTQS